MFERKISRSLAIAKRWQAPLLTRISVARADVDAILAAKDPAKALADYYRVRSK